MDSVAAIGGIVGVYLLAAAALAWNCPSSGSGVALAGIAANLPTMSNVATRKDVQDMARVLTVRFAVAVVLMVGAVGGLILSR